MPKKYRVLLTASIAGFLGLTIQILGSQIAFYHFSQSSYAMAISLGAFLAGLSLASWLSYRFRNTLQNHRAEVYYAALLATALFCLIFLYRFDDFSMAYLSVARNYKDLAKGGGEIFFGLLCAGNLFIPALLLGPIFPLANDHLREMHSTKMSTGLVNFWDLLGAALGGLMAGFVLVPWLGLAHSALVVAALAGIFSLLWCNGKKIRLLLSVIIISIPAFLLGSVYIARAPAPMAGFGKVLFQKNSPFGMITIANTEENGKILYINYRAMCASQAAGAIRAIAQIPILLLPRERLRALNVGLGCGFTANALAQSSKVSSLTIAEINPVVAEASGRFFKEENRVVFEYPRKIDLKIQDGMQLMRERASQKDSKPFDIVVMDIEEPNVIHSTALFTQDYFKMVRVSLANDGIFGIWSFDHPETNKIILNTLHSVFPYVIIYPMDEQTLFFASSVPYGFPLTDLARKRVDIIKKIPNREIATIRNNPYAKFPYDEVMKPPGWKDPEVLIPKHAPER